MGKDRLGIIKVKTYAPKDIVKEEKKTIPELSFDLCYAMANELSMFLWAY
jgi:hypothetical protein